MLVAFQEAFVASLLSKIPFWLLGKTWTQEKDKYSHKYMQYTLGFIFNSLFVHYHLVWAGRSTSSEEAFMSHFGHL